MCAAGDGRAFCNAVSDGADGDDGVGVLDSECVEVVDDGASGVDADVGVDHAVGVDHHGGVLMVFRSGWLCFWCSCYCCD